MGLTVDSRRRSWGVFFLTSAAVLLILGETFLKPTLGRSTLLFLGYWMVCFLFTGLAVFTALLDVRAIRKRVRAQHEELLERALADRDQRPEVRGQKSEIRGQR